MKLLKIVNEHPDFVVKNKAMQPISIRITQDKFIVSIDKQWANGSPKDLINYEND